MRSRKQRWTRCSRLSVTKNEIYILTLVVRKTCCILGWAVVWVRTQAALQQVVDQALKAKCYFSDGFDAHHKQRFPNYEHHVMDFVSPLF